MLTLSSCVADEVDEKTTSSTVRGKAMTRGNLTNRKLNGLRSLPYESDQGKTTSCSRLRESRSSGITPWAASSASARQIKVPNWI